MKEYKVGSVVKIKSFSWYNKNKDIRGYVLPEVGPKKSISFTRSMTEYCGKTLKIKDIYFCSTCEKDHYQFERNGIFFDEWMFENTTDKYGQLELDFGY